ncbi:hypothetical protein ACFOMD_12760 [Sphingoaurantiacus capsulatus]|uniref:Uncharacterized protein n=1 Tax=Sphingoaurantiacus capsulatus TaxID=1771310 RepID=A0ABV7XBI6_9SPHN
MTLRRSILLAAAALALAPLSPIVAQPAPVEGFADIADLTIGAPVVLKAAITKASKLSRKEAPDVPEGRVRLLIEAQVQGVLTAREAVPAKISYLWDGSLDARGKVPKLKGLPVILFLKRVPGREGQYQLTSRNGQIAGTARSEQHIRRVLSDIRQPDIRDLRVTGLGNAFHVRGSIPGEAESQIFINTATGRPVSLVVLSRPGQAKSYSVALSDVIDDAATTIPRDTLMWYHLACQLPRALPAGSVDQLEDADKQAVAADYGFVLTSLGACGRTLR